MSICTMNYDIHLNFWGHGYVNVGGGGQTQTGLGKEF